MSARGQNFLLGSFGSILLLVAAGPLQAQSERTYAGAQACAKCHAGETHAWTESRHNKIMQAATPESVEGNFSVGRIELRGVTYILQRRDRKFYIAESDGAGKQWEHRIEYTLGERRIQHYLSTLPDGRIVVLPTTWDNIGKKWIDATDSQNPEESAEGTQVWNKSCYSCHVSRGQKNFDLNSLSYRTTWQSLGIDCESCHGPGSEHVAKASGAKGPDADLRAMLKQTIVNPAKLDATRSTMICAECHSFRDAYADGFTAGANYYDYFLPVMQYRLPESDDPPYWGDGRPRWFANESLAFWQSQCFLKGGATCATCHKQPHQVNVSAQTGSEANAACAGCHKGITADISKHTHHAEKSAGSACLGCHMPQTVVGVGSRMRDHSISVPVPKNTATHGIPNACNLCHTDKNAEWASQQVSIWYGDNLGMRLSRRADAFAAARRSDQGAISLLLQILNDDTESALIRANAAGYLGGFPNNPWAYNAVERALSDAQPLVRATAAVAIRPRAAQREALAPKLVSLLSDPVSTVRVSAATALVAMGAREVPAEDQERFERAKEIYGARAELDADDAQQQFAAGRFFLLAGDMNGAVAAFRASLKLDPATPAQFDLGRALAGKGDPKQAREVIATIPRNDPQYEAAQEFLATLDLKKAGQSDTDAASAGSEANRGDAQAAFLEGQVLYRKTDYSGALPQLERALQLSPNADWAVKARSYRAVCLEKLGRTREAEDAMNALSGEAEARTDVDLQLAYAELLDETGRADEALKRIDDVIASVPDAAMAYWWRAKVLLQLHRIDEAAKAAEACVRLMPDLPAGHNLLLRIYQVQGRSKEAAEQAAWLHDYQQRLESR